MKKIASLNETDKPIIAGMGENLTVFESLQLVSGQMLMEKVYIGIYD